MYWNILVLPFCTAIHLFYPCLGWRSVVLISVWLTVCTCCAGSSLLAIKINKRGCGSTCVFRRKESCGRKQRWLLVSTLLQIGMEYILPHHSSSCPPDNVEGEIRRRSLKGLEFQLKMTHFSLKPINTISTEVAINLSHDLNPTNKDNDTDFSKKSPFLDQVLYLLPNLQFKTWEKAVKLLWQR